MRDLTKFKAWGIGSLSLPIAIFSAMFSFTYVCGKYVGQHILDIFNLSLPLTAVSMFLFCLSILIGYKHKDDYYAKPGVIFSIVLMIIISGLWIIRLML